MSRTILVLAVSGWVMGWAAMAYGQCGEAPSDNACTPRIIPGDPGAYEIIMGLSGATPDTSMACGANVGHSVWIQVTPTNSGLVTFSTCAPGTTFDTVLQVWKSTGDCEFPLRLDDLCADDTSDTMCNNPCGLYRGSEVSFIATGGTTYLIQVGSYDNNSAFCTLCLDLLVSICGGDTTPPVASITWPLALECSCSPVTVTGFAYDPGAAIEHYTLEYKSAGGTTWTAITTSSLPVYGGTLGVWNTAGLPEDYYVLRLTTVDFCGLVNTAVQVVWVSQQFDTVEIGGPAENAIVGGLVCLGGTVWDGFCFDHYTADYRPAAGGSYSPIIPGPSNVTTPKVNEVLASWNTLSGIVDGAYSLRIIGTDDCGHSLTTDKNLVVDNTSPTAVLTTPLSCAYVDGVVQVRGSAFDTHLSSWILEYTGGTTHGWMPINQGTLPVINGLLANWDTSALPACAYTLRLRVYDTSVVQSQCGWPSYHMTEYTTSVIVGNLCPVDLNGDGNEDLLDYAIFQGCFTGP
jgi:hypothetical protein